MHSRDIIFGAATVAFLAGIGLMSAPFSATSATLDSISSIAGILLLAGGILVSIAMLVWAALEKPATAPEDDDPPDPGKGIVDE